MKKHLLFTAAVIAVAGVCYPVTVLRADNAAMSPTNETGDQLGDKIVNRSVQRSLADVVDASTRHDGFTDLGKDLQRDSVANNAGSNSGNTNDSATNTNGNNANGMNNNANGSADAANNGAAANQPNAASSATNGNAMNSSDNATLSFQNQDDINKAVDQLHQDWKDKYGKDFNFSNDMQAQVFNDGYQITVGNVGDLARSASDRMSADNNNGQQPSDVTKQNVKGATDVAQHDPNFENNPNQPNVNNNTPADGEAKLNQHLNGSQHYATVAIAATGSGSACNLLLTNRNDTVINWKVAVPPGITEQQIHDALLKHLTALDSQKASWPADESDAYKAVTREVLTSFSESCSMKGMNGNSISNTNGQPNQGNTGAGAGTTPGGTGDMSNGAAH